MSITELFKCELKVINIGLAVFYETLEQNGVDSRQVDAAPADQDQEDNVHER